MDELYFNASLKASRIVDSCITVAHLQAASRMLRTFEAVWVNPAMDQREYNERLSNCMTLQQQIQEMTDGILEHPLGFEYSARVRYYYDLASNLYSSYIENGGDMDYPFLEYCNLDSELDEVEVGFFKDTIEEPGGEYAEKLRIKGFTMTEEQAYATLKHRVEVITEYLKTRQVA